MPVPLRVIRDPDEMRAASDALRAAGQRLGFVPTMGFLHEGHLSLIERAAGLCDVVCLSIFVNPAQFDDPGDLQRYPRDLEGDLAKAAAAGAQLAYVPDTTKVYPEGYQTWVTVGELTERLCGASRPGHFKGVATVVTKLFNVVRPHVAVFGEKDYQQQLVIKRLAADLEMGIEVVAAPTVREPDGLAMSSRNARLSAEERVQALALSQALREAREAFDGGERSATALIEIARKCLRQAEVRLDYVEVLDAETLAPVDPVGERALVALAGFVGETRLIDNTVLGRQEPR